MLIAEKISWINYYKIQKKMIFFYALIKIWLYKFRRKEKKKEKKETRINSNKKKKNLLVYGLTVSKNLMYSSANV